MDTCTDIDQTLEGNILVTLNFEKALQDVLYWLRKEQNTFNRYLNSHPSVREVAVEAFQGFIRSVPLLSPAATPSPDDDLEQTPSPNTAEHTRESKQPHNTERAGSEECSVPLSSPLTDEIEGNGRPDEGSRTQHHPRDRARILETSHQETPASTDPDNDPLPMTHPKQGNDHIERLHQIAVVIGEGARFEPGDCDVSRDVLISGDVDAVQPVGDGHTQDVLPCPAAELQLPSSTNIRGLKRKRNPVSYAERNSKPKRKLMDSSDPEPLPANVIEKIQDIATFDDIVFLWERLQLLSTSIPISDQKSTCQGSQPTLPLQPSSRRRRLEMLWSCISDNAKNERWATVMKRICQAEFFGQYLEDRARFNQWKVQRKNKERCQMAPNEAEKDGLPRSHPLAEYVDLCSPDTIIRDGKSVSQDAKDNRERAKKKFENMVQTNEPWVKFNQRFGKGVFVVISALRDEHLRKLGKPQLDLLINLINAAIPRLKEQLIGLSQLLSFFIEHGQLPPYMLQIELFSKDQLESIRFTGWLLNELLKPCQQRHLSDSCASTNSPLLNDECLTQEDLVASSALLSTSHLAQSTSYAPSATDTNGSLQESSLDYQFLCSPIEMSEFDYMMSSF